MSQASLRIVRAVPRLPKRASDAHKGDFGRVLVVGGARGMIGAPALAANAAFRGGCGLVQMALPDGIQLHAATLAPCATSLPLPSTARGWISARAALPALRLLWEKWADAVALGPGMDRSEDGVRLVSAALATCAAPIVLDADGLNNATGAPAALTARRAPLVLTPHAGEMQRLLEALELSFDARTQRRACAVALSLRTGAVVVLKGAGTLVTDGARLFVNRTGNPGMATGGSGDVLTGLIAGLIAQRLTPFDAAVLGVFVHGRAGDLAAGALSEASMMATDLLDYLPAAMRTVERS